MTAPPNYYELLQVSPDAEIDIIQSAYKRLVQKWHADRKPGDRTAFERLAALDEAFAVLSDPQKRTEFESRRIRAVPMTVQACESLPTQIRWAKKPPIPFSRVEGAASRTADDYDHSLPVLAEKESSTVKQPVNAIEPATISRTDVAQVPEFNRNELRSQSPAP